MQSLFSKTFGMPFLKDFWNAFFQRSKWNWTTKPVQISGSETHLLLPFLKDFYCPFLKGCVVKLFSCGSAWEFFNYKQIKTNVILILFIFDKWYMYDISGFIFLSSETLKLFPKKTLHCFFVQDIFNTWSWNVKTSTFFQRFRALWQKHLGGIWIQLDANLLSKVMCITFLKVLSNHGICNQDSKTSRLPPPMYPWPLQS